MLNIGVVKRRKEKENGGAVKRRTAGHVVCSQALSHVCHHVGFWF
jgi:hypothetical protein